jgi:probable HAF family extracellular repeat protein
MTIYTTIPVLPSGINNAGQIVTPSGIWRDGTLTPVRVGNFSTTSTGINNQGQVVGIETDQGSPGTFVSQGFLYSNGRLSTTLSLLGTLGINDLGQIVGTWNQPTLYSGGTYTVISTPGAPVGINNAGQIVGSYFDSAHTTHGFLYDPSTGTYTTLDDPLGAGGTQATGINNAGQIVGYFTDVNGGVHGFIDTGGVFTTVDEPSATGFTRVLGINDLGQIVGTYVDASGQHGFLGSPPPPPPPPGTSAAMILRRGDGNYQIYNIGNNAILGSFQLGQVRSRLGIRHARRFLRRRHQRHAAAQLQYRRLRGL